MKIDFANLADGAVAEITELELQRVLENIHDPNTDHKKVREITIKLKLKSNEKRDVIDVDISTTKKLAPIKSVETRFLMGRDKEGRVAAKELKSGVQGQTYLDNDGKGRDDVGNPVVEPELKKDSNVVNFK